MLDLIYKVDKDKKVKYVWFDTGLEYQATKEHLVYLENRYNIGIERIKAIKPIPLCCKEYGQPFLSKYVSQQIRRLQEKGFKWEDKPFDELIKEYPNCRGGLNWWCNNNNKVSFNRKNPYENKNTSKFDINYNLYLKEFMLQNPPMFKISDSCCDWSKKKVAKQVIKKNGYDLDIVGIRKAEGGIRSASYKNCFSIVDGGADMYRPLFWFTHEDREYYEIHFNIIHSCCYTKYGFPRTGCCCCPYGGKSLQNELKQTKANEPKLYNAVCNVFKESYEYTKQYRQFVREMKDKEKGKRRLF